MGRVTGRDQEVINQLIVDCNIYSLNEKESLEYIKQRLGRVYIWKNLQKIQDESKL